MSNKKPLKPGVYAWYTKKNCYVKVLTYDMESDSYTVKYKDRVIDTTSDFLLEEAPPPTPRTVEENCIVS